MLNANPYLQIKTGTNPYNREVQGKANEPICVLNLLLRAKEKFDFACDASQQDIVERLDANAPRVAIITGSPDHPAHVVDYETTLLAAASIWRRGGVPFAFGVPVMCDGTAQSNLGMSYSLESRNLVAQMVVNQMESHAYHGAFVIQGCDKTPFGIVSGLAMLDRVRQSQGEAPLFASFAPAHVLRGGTIPPELKQELLALADKAAGAGKTDLADDLRLTVKHILQCSSNQAFQGVFKRLVQAGLLTPEKHKSFEKELAAHTCHIHGGICAFNGTGNSCRHAVSAFGLVHPELELLTDPPRYEQVDAAVQSMLAVCNDSQYSVSHIVKQNKENAIRVHAATGGSTNLMMHLVSAIIYAGERFSIHDYEKVRTNTQVPDMMNYSLTEGRDIFVLAEQRQRGTHAGMATVLYELKNQGIPVHEDAPTMAGCSWGERLKQDERLSAANERENPILLSTPKRPAGGIDVLAGNFFESAVVKISGMTEQQFHHFDNKIALVLYFENEEEAVAHLLDENILSKVCRESGVTQKTLLHMYTHNTGKDVDDLQGIADVQTMFTRLVETEALRIAVLIAGQGPEAFGMPEMFTPTQHLNHNRTLKKICAILSDGRFSGVSYGAVIGHMTPEAYRQGGILYLQSGDVLHLRLTQRELLLLEKNALEGGTIQPYAGDLAAERRALGEERLRTMQSRRRKICPANQMGALTDAAHGVAPHAVWAWAE